MDFLTPELFDRLIIANLIVGLLLIGGRFYIDMRDPNDLAKDNREQQHDEASHEDDTHENTALSG